MSFLSHPRAHLPVLIVLVLLIRLPFLNQAIQGDDYYYLTGAMHAQIDPLHPTHGQYVFNGRMVDMRGHPHPPLNMWILGGLLAALGDINEPPFHAAYVIFSLIAALGIWALSRRFSPAPLWASLLFLATPAFVINGNSFESDVPFLAFWMASVALFVGAVDRRSSLRLLVALLCLAAAALSAYQSVLLIPILALYLFLHARNWVAGWLALGTPAATLAIWQLFERITGGVLPADVLAGHFEAYGFQQLSNKLDNAIALTVHCGWILFPLLAVAAFGKVPRWSWLLILPATATAGALLDPDPLFWAVFGVGLLVVLWCVLALRDWRDKDQFFLAAWASIFFAAALVLFFAGSARYLLPMAAPLCLLASRTLAHRRSWLAAGFAFQLALALGLSIANYDHWDGYRRFVESIREQFPQRRVWVNAEWGLRYYAEAEGGLALELNQPVQPGDAVLTSEISYPIDFTTGGGVPSPIKTANLQPRLPFRLIGLGARSAYSTVTLGYRPFDLVFGPIDHVRAEIVIERQPTLSFLPMNAPEAEAQIVSGVYKLENDAWRWMAQHGVLLLKRPAEPAPVEAAIYIPENSPVRQVSLWVNGVERAAAKYSAPGSYTIRTPEPIAAPDETVTVEIVGDANFIPPGDQRPLALVLASVGFVASP